MADAPAPGRKKTVFTDEVLRAIPRWKNSGASTEDIAEVLGTTANSVRVACSAHGISLQPPTFSNAAISDGALRRGMGEQAWGKLRQEAMRRRMPTAQLVVDVMEIIVQDNLFNAVFGEGDEDDE